MCAKNDQSKFLMYLLLNPENTRHLLTSSFKKLMKSIHGSCKRTMGIQITIVDPDSSGKYDLILYIRPEILSKKCYIKGCIIMNSKNVKYDVTVENLQEFFKTGNAVSSLGYRFNSIVTPDIPKKHFDITQLIPNELCSLGYINISEEGWQERYYSELFGIEINDERRTQICINYLEGLEWNFKYYTQDCPDWKWRYKYKYPPLLEDLIKYVPYFDTEFIEFKKENPVKPLVQLAYVLPRNSLDLLPKNIYESLIINHESWYRLDYEIIWAYCKYFWESHIVLPDINIDTLDRLITSKIS